MACDCPEPLDCCQRCPEPPAPVLPRCDITLVDGVFTNATVVVEDGCITEVATGRPPQYSPAVCCDDTCSPGGGGGGEVGPPGRDGEDGENATITVGSVTTLPPGEAGYIVNVGTDTNAILNFYIPAGEPGASGGDTHGIDSDAAGIVFEDGILKQLPGSWPPAMAFVTNSITDGVTLDATQPDQYTGVVSLTINLDAYTLLMRTWVNERLEEETEPLDTRLTAAEAKINTLEAKVAALEAQVAVCCP